MRPTPFLKEIAVYLLQSDHYRPEESCLVFPNKRARVYFSRYLSELSEIPVWTPDYLTINELMEEFSGLVYADKLTLVFELYRLYLDLTGSDEEFDSFYPMCETLLSDFDDIDKYLIDAEDLYQNLSALHDLKGKFNYLTEEQIRVIQQFWKTFNPDHLSRDQQTFLSLWEILPILYLKFKERLALSGLSYEGMAYRQVVEMISTPGKSFAGNKGYKKYFFVGFNALNTCEEKLFRYFKNLGMAEFFYDYDPYYVNNSVHEAGFFIRKNLKNFPPAIWNKDSILTTGQKKITIVPVSSNTGQAMALQATLDKLNVTPGGNSYSDTAIVLADEGLLMPVLYNVPEHIREINITMGYPATESPVFGLVNSLHELAKQNGTKDGGTPSYHYLHILSLVNNPLLTRVFDEKKTGIRRFIRDTGRTRLKADILPDFPEKERFFANKEMQDHTSRYLVGVFNFIIHELLDQEQETSSTSSIQLDIIYYVFTLVNRLHDLITTTQIKPGVETLFRLLKKMLRNYRIPFQGEPLAGVQIMGLLETRTLDFENVIILSVNEGILPKSPHHHSFIPNNLRKGFGLPAPDHFDAIFAYYFYRLLQRAKNVVLMYDTSSEGMRTGERSRFIHQLLYESPINISKFTHQFPVNQIPTKKIQVDKNEEIAEILSGFIGAENNRILTPSAINEYLNCSLKFYYRYILKLPQPDEMSDTVDPRTFGNLLHNCMNQIYGNAESPSIGQRQLETLLKDPDYIHAVLDQVFEEEVFRNEKTKAGEQIRGLHLVVRKILYKYVVRLLEYDLKHAPFRIISLEKSYAIGMPLERSELGTDLINKTHGDTMDINLGGIIDRIDLCEGVVRILDYKTGKLKNSFPDIASLFDSATSDRNDAALQVLIYCYVYGRLYPETAVEPGLLFIRNSHADDFTHRIQCGRKLLTDFSEVEQEVHMHLNLLLKEIFGSREPFSQTNNLKMCGYCPYAGICHR